MREMPVKGERHFYEKPDEAAINPKTVVSDVLSSRRLFNLLPLLQEA